MGPEGRDLTNELTYMKQLELFQQSMETGELQAIDDTFHLLLDCKVSCHKAHRKK